MAEPIRLPHPPLANGEVALREWLDEDVPAVTEMVQDPEIPRWTQVPSPYGEEDARAFIARQRRAREDGEWLALAIVGARDGALLGAIGLDALDRGAGSAKIGYWVGREARRRGVATRAVRLLSRWALLDLGLERLEITTFLGNEASERVAERAGYRREGRLAQPARHASSGEVRELTLFTLTRGSVGVP